MTTIFSTLGYLWGLWAEPFSVIPYGDPYAAGFVLMIVLSFFIFFGFRHVTAE